MVRVAEFVMALGMSIQIYMSIRLFDKIAVENYKNLGDNAGYWTLAFFQLIGTFIFFFNLLMLISVGNVGEYCKKIAPEPSSTPQVMLLGNQVFLNPLTTAGSGNVYSEFSGKMKAFLMITLVFSFFATLIPGMILLGLRVKEVEWQAGWLTTGAILIFFSSGSLMYKRYKK